MKTLRWFALILALALLASFLDVPTVGLAGASMVASFGTPIGHSFIISNQSTEELDPAVAYNSQQREYLAVFWNDRPGNDDIRAERVSWDGKLLGGVWVAAGVGTDRQYPDVAYNSARNEYLVVWQQYTAGGSESSIYGQRLSVPTGSGNPQLQGGPISIAPGGSFASCFEPAVAYSSTSDKYLVVFTYGWWPPYRIQGRVVLSDGSLPGSVFDVSSPTTWSQERPDLAYNRRLNGYLVVWQQKVGDYDIYARIVHPSGTPIGPDSFIISSLPIWEETMPTVAAIPTATSLGEYLVVWESDDSTDAAVRSQLVTGDGNLTGLTPHNVHWYATGAYAISAVAGNENSQQFLIVLKANASWSFSAIAISSDLVQWSPWYVLDSGPGADHPAIASGQTGDFLVAFDRPPFGTRDIYGQLWGSIRLYLPLILRNY
jgi:hypothetical protein